MTRVVFPAYNDGRMMSKIFVVRKYNRTMHRNPLNIADDVDKKKHRLERFYQVLTPKKPVTTVIGVFSSSQAVGMAH